MVARIQKGRKYYLNNDVVLVTGAEKPTFGRGSMVVFVDVETNEVRKVTRKYFSDVAVSI